MCTTVPCAAPEAAMPLCRSCQGAGAKGGALVKWTVFVAALALPIAAVFAQQGGTENTYTTGNVVVRYSGIPEECAVAFAKTTEAACAAALAVGADMPQTITVYIDTGDSSRLFMDGEKSLHLTVKSEADFRKPRESGVFMIYGVCHEIAHLAMYRPIKERMWMTTAAAEGWADYFGSRLVDAVYEKEGMALWPDRYDYREDGMARMRQGLAAREPSELSRGAGLWADLAGIIGDAGIIGLFTAWGQTAVDSVEPGPALRNALLSTNQAGGLSVWWSKAEPAFVVARPKSDFAAASGPADQLSGRPRELGYDDGQQAGQRSIAGTGHAVVFDAPGDGWYLTAVLLMGSRYGTNTPPNEDFHVWLCDANFREIADFPFPYSTFAKGEPQEVKLDVKPTKVPRRFVICIGFNPTSTKGVFVYHDKAAGGRSFTALPGGQARRFDSGDWLIRAMVDAKADVRAQAIELAGKPQELANDDGQDTGKRSIAGGGHEVLFDAGGDDRYLVAVRIYGGRYGTSSPPNEDFRMWLCDENFREIAEFAFPYATFADRNPKDALLEVAPTKVPRKFVICVGFNPTSTKGVYVYHDKEGTGKSFTGLPGRQGSRFDQGDWLIRAFVDQRTSSQ